MSTPAELNAALTAAVSAEDACIYAYGVIGAQVSGAPQARARRALASHHSWRDRLQSETPDVIPSAIAYDFPFPVSNPASAKRLAALIENRMVGVYADVAAAADTVLRTEAVTAAMECAARAVTWGAESQAFPQA
jgi:hypothetical protein